MLTQVTRQTSQWPNGRPTGRFPESPVRRLDDYAEGSVNRRFLVRHEQRFQDLGGSIDSLRDTVTDEISAAHDLLRAFRLPTSPRRLTSEPAP